jgi:hypothetical protein
MTLIKRRTLRREGNALVAESSPQAPVAAAKSLKNMNPGPCTINRIETVRFCAFAPPGTPLNHDTLSISTAESGLIVFLSEKTRRVFFSAFEKFP